MSNAKKPVYFFNLIPPISKMQLLYSQYLRKNGQWNEDRSYDE